MEIPYTICFCCYQQQILMLYRNFPPNTQLWNGLGGKIEAGETPLHSIRREILEEAAIDLLEASSLFFAGIVTWASTGCDLLKGMYAFIAHLSQQQAEQIHALTTPEGLIAWKPRAWVCDPHNHAVVSNIPRFLPPMLQAHAPCEYFCEYGRDDLVSEAFRQLVRRPLPSHIALSDCQE
jgi:8-oxo-dGTP diphosphatase